MTIIRIGLDTSKHVFQIHGVDENEQPGVRRQIRRSEVAEGFAKLAPTRIGLGACGAAHHWARVLRGLGHEVMLLPPQYIKPMRKGISITVTPAYRVRLQSIIRDRNSPQKHVWRARIVVLTADGEGTTAVMRAV